MRALRPAEIGGYVGSGEWQGKAGGYAIQGIAGAFVRTINGSYSNVVGLPLCEVLEDLDALGALPADWALGGE
jgi:septum formation protein